MTASDAPLFTISIPTYNRADGYLRETLQSAVAQRYQDMEILVSDNCSTDHTAEVVASFSDPRLRYVKHEKNLGHEGNFNFCIEGARGAYVLVLHDDDLIDPDFIETCARHMSGRTDYAMLRTGVRVIDAEGRTLEEHVNHSRGDSGVDGFLQDLFQGAPLYMCHSVYHRQRLLEVGGFTSPKRLYHDLVAVVRLVATGPRLEMADIKASFRRHGESRGTVSKMADWVEDACYLVGVIAEVTKNNRELVEQAKQYFCKKMYWYAVRVVASPLARFKVYRYISKRFDHCYPYYRFIWLRWRSMFR